MKTSYSDKNTKTSGEGKNYSNAQISLTLYLVCRTGSAEIMPVGFYILITAYGGLMSS